MDLQEALRPKRLKGDATPSGLRLFKAVLLIRWASLAVASIGYLRNLSTHEMEYGSFVPVCVAAIVYTALLSYFARPVYEFHMRSRLFLALDYAVTLAAFSLTGGVWNPFLVFGACSFLFAGLHGTLDAGVLGGLGLVLPYVASLAIKGLSLASLTRTDGLSLAFVYCLEFLVFSIAWAYTARLLSTLNEAYGAAAANRDELARAHAVLDERQRQLMALHGIRHAILLKLEPAAIIEIVRRSLDEMGFHGARTWLLEGERLTALPEDQETPDVDSFGDSPLAVAVHDRETVIVEGVPGEGPLHETPGELASGAYVPILTGDESLGAIEVPNLGAEQFTTDQIETLRLFADQVALALQHVRLYQDARGCAVSEERNRITTEIHDTVVEKLHDAGALIEALHDEQLSADVRRRLRVLKDTILASLQDLRFAVLNWDSLEWESTPAVLAQRYTEEFTALSGIPVAFAARGDDGGLSGAKAKDLLRMLQETLSNVWRHAQASSVQVGLVFERDGVSLSVRDDGQGFDVEAVAKGSGIGLRSIQGRGERHGGVVDVDSAPGDGTHVRVWMPC